ncbi:hydantoinase B/oxoprolinase family protein [Variovorax boronicumulans]
MNTSTTTIDPIRLALTQSRLDHIAKQMGWVMIQTSRSPIFNQSHDFSCFLTDAAGQLVSQADGIPIHTGSGGFAVRAILKAFAGKIEEGDVYLANDPYLAGGNHLPDWLIARPIFVGGRCIAFACNRSHQSDIGGGAAGTYNAAATEIFHEGIRLPPLKLVERGEIREDLWQMLLANTRCPDLVDGDVRAMLGSTDIGGRHVAALAEDMGLDQTEAYFREILDYADRRMGVLLTGMRQGVYQSEEGYDHDCFDPCDVRIRVKITVADGQATVDFTGTAPQIKGFKNSSLANTCSAVYAAFASFFEKDLPRNEGTFRRLKIIAPEGTVVNAKAPAPLTMCTVFPAHEIMHACWWALGLQAPRENIAGWGKNAFPITSGNTDGKGQWVMYHWGGTSGGGAVAGRDGFNQIGPMCTLGGLMLPNAETYELLYPVRIYKQEFRCDSAGPGEFRGGTGVDYEVDVLVEAEWTFRGEGAGRPTGLGVSGGGEGKGGEVTLAYGDATESAPKYAVVRKPPVRLSISSPGGGGFGNPKERPLQSVLLDVRNGVLSETAAREIYGVDSRLSPPLALEQVE